MIGVAALPGTGRSQTASLESFDGTWTLAGGQRDMDDAINRVVDQLNVFIREIARGEIHRRLDPEQRVRLIVEDEDAVSLGWDDWGPVRVPLDGRSHSVRGPDGDRVRISMRFHRGRLFERHVAGQGTRRNVFSLSADASRLSMAVSIGADQLPSDIRYRLTYRRVR